MTHHRDRSSRICTCFHFSSLTYAWPFHSYTACLFLYFKKRFVHKIIVLLLLLSNSRVLAIGMGDRGSLAPDTEDRGLALYLWLLALAAFGFFHTGVKKTAQLML